MLTLISFTTLILSAYGATRYIIDEYILPDTDDPLNQDATIIQVSPFPIDVCVGYKVSFDITKGGVVNFYGIYTCNDDGDEVTFTDYINDEKCEDYDVINANNKVISYDASLNPGEVGEFNCDGMDNYVQVGAYTVSGKKEDYDGGRICCGDSSDYYLGITVSTFATEVCVFQNTSLGVFYGYGVCDDEESETILFVDDTCQTPTGSSEGAARPDLCEQFAASDLASVYRLQTNCIVDGMEMKPNMSVCATDPPTSHPTLEPTEITDAPTYVPTSEPESEDSNDSKGYMFTINGMVLLIMGMAIFV